MGIFKDTYIHTVHEPKDWQTVIQINKQTPRQQKNSKHIGRNMETEIKKIDIIKL